MILYKLKVFLKFIPPYRDRSQLFDVGTWFPPLNKSVSDTSLQVTSCVRESGSKWPTALIPPTPVGLLQVGVAAEECRVTTWIIQIQVLWLWKTHWTLNTRNLLGYECLLSIIIKLKKRLRKDIQDNCIVFYNVFLLARQISNQIWMAFCYFLR